MYQDRQNDREMDQREKRHDDSKRSQSFQGQSCDNANSKHWSNRMMRLPQGWKKGIVCVYVCVYVWLGLGQDKVEQEC